MRQPEVSENLLNTPSFNYANCMSITGVQK